MHGSGSGFGFRFGSGSSPPPSPPCSGSLGPSGVAYSRGDVGVFGSSRSLRVSSTGLSKAEVRALIEGVSEVGASPLARKMLLGRAEVPKVLRGCTGVRGSPALRIAPSPGLEPARLELSVV